MDTAENFLKGLIESVQESESEEPKQDQPHNSQIRARVGEVHIQWMHRIVGP